MFFVGKPIEALICLILQVTLIGWAPAAIWAVLVVNGHHADKRNKELIKAMKQDKSSN